MSLQLTIPIIVGLVGFITAIGSFVLGLLKRKPEQEASISQAAENAVAAISETLTALREELADSKKERRSLRQEVGKLRRQIVELEFEIIGLKRQLNGVNDLPSIPPSPPPSD